MHIQPFALFVYSCVVCWETFLSPYCLNKYCILFSTSFKSLVRASPQVGTVPVLMYHIPVCFMVHICQNAALHMPVMWFSGALMGEMFDVLLLCLPFADDSWCTAVTFLSAML